MLRLLASTLAVTTCATALQAQTADRVPLDHSAYEEWKAIEDEALSDDGAWLHYRLTLQDGDATLMVRGLDGDAAYAIPRGEDAIFTTDGRHLVFTIVPELQASRAARRAKLPEDRQPKDSLGILNLASGEIVRVPDVRSFAVPEEGGAYVAYSLHRPTPDSEAEGDTTAGEPRRGERDRGTTLVLRELATGAEQRLEFVSHFRFSRDGTRLAYATATPGDGDGVFLVRLGIGETRTLAAGYGDYRSLAFDDAGRQVAFLTSRDSADAKPAPYALYVARDGAEAGRVAGIATAGMPSGWWVSEREAPRFSPDGRRLFFGTMPAPRPEPEDSLLDEEKVTVEIWHWRDPLLQPMQQVQLRQERERRYTAVVHLANGRVTQLADDAMPEVRVGGNGNADIAVGTSERPYRMETSWDFPEYRDVYLVDVGTGERRLALERTQANPTLSPESRYLTWYDHDRHAWLARATEGGEEVNLTAGIPHPLFDEEHDAPSPAPPYGSAGWTAGDRLFLVYDRYDVWALDPRGRARPVAVTDGVGRREGIRFRVVDLDDDDDALDPAEPLLLAAFHYRTKDAGFYRDRVDGTMPPERLVDEPSGFTTPRKAADAPRLVYARSAVDEFPDLWVSDLAFRGARKATDANPQQRRYRWATVELVEWTSADGVPLQGLLYKPEDFDPSRRYPMIVNFYERDSDNLHTYFAPVPHRSVIRPVFYASRGYLVFIPDVRYRIGYPGESALAAIVPGVLHLVQRGYVDETRIGIQGHSWGGYQIAYLVTRTNLFRAAAGGAPVANMVSAYGGIRYGTGMSRMFQYERTQSRIGSTLWEAPLRYLENSPIFWADRIRTPLLMMHNDRDHAVPFTQGVELFTALRRLGTPAWLVNYTGELHWPQAFAERRDWNIRMQQYFDHYLMDAPAPAWLAEGIPAIERARTLGLELIERE